MELADPHNVLAIFSFADGVRQVGRLVEGLAELPTAAVLGTERIERKMPLLPTNAFERRVPLHVAVDLEQEAVPLAQAAGRVAAEMVIPYPPGIPLLTPGEVWTADLIHYVEEWRASGVRFQGVEDLSLTHVQVLRHTT